MEGEGEASNPGVSYTRPAKCDFVARIEIKLKKVSKFIEKMGLL